MTPTDIHIAKSISNTIAIASQKAEDAINKDEKDTELRFVIDSKSASITDLYAQSRIFLCILAVKKLGFPVSLRIDQKKRRKGDRLSSIEQSGLIECLENQGIETSSTVKIKTSSAKQLKFDFFKHANARNINLSNYPILPLSKFSTGNNLTSESDALTKTREILGEIASISLDQMNKIGIKKSDIFGEFGHILWALLKELLLNAIIHSGERELYVALSIRRETGVYQRSHRPGVPGKSTLSSTWLWDVCVFDAGHGIFPTVDSTLRNISVEEVKKNLKGYLAFTSGDKINDFNFSSVQQLEWRLLSSIFQGNLGVRKGRRSEGLYETGKQLHWSGGQINLRTGRTGLAIWSTHVRESHAKNREKYNYYLPGTIIGAVLPSRQLGVAKNRYKLEQSEHYFKDVFIPARKIEQDVVLYRSKKLSSAFFASQGDFQTKRDGEVIAKRIIEEYEKGCDLILKEREEEESQVDTASNPIVFLEIDLKYSNDVDPEFLGVLLQELSKSFSPSRRTEAGILRKILITNTRRNIINALKISSCNAFLMMRKQILLLLDEGDNAHLLGVPRLTDKIYDIEDAFLLILQHQNISVNLLQKEFNYDEQQINFLIDLIGDFKDNIFYYKEQLDGINFYDHKIIELIKEERKKRLKNNRKEFVRTPGENAVISLMNGTYVDKIFDFSAYWAQSDRLIDAAKVLIFKMDLFPVHCVIGFMNNGDCLAGTLQELLGAPQLLILDPHNKETWTAGPRGTGCILVLDAICPGDNSSGYIHDFMTDSGGIVVEAIVAFVDFRHPDKKGEKLHNASLYSSNINLMEGFLEEQDVTTETATLAFSEEGFPPPTRIEHQPSRTNSVPQVTNNIPQYVRYSEIELSAEFWHNCSSLDLVASKKTGREERNVIFFENNERIIENYRTRRHLETYLTNFVQKQLNLRIDVVLHPTHPVGAFLANLVARKLNKPLQILPLTQTKYGGDIRISIAEYESIMQQLCKQDNRPRLKLRALIVDDSVLSGKSLFTMLGIADKLGLQVIGVFVLMNKLSPAVSAAMSTLPFAFSYLYRLHMPLLNHGESPYEVIRQNAIVIRVKTKSVFSHYWSCELIDYEKEYHLYQDIKEKKGDRLSDVSFNLKSDTSQLESNMKNYELSHIIEGLILHKDENILDFDRKVAIAYNFMEQLAREDEFWRLLQVFVTHGLNKNTETTSIWFVRRIMLLMVSSHYMQIQSTRSHLRELCKETAHLILKDDRWEKLPGIVCDCFMILSILGDASLFGFLHLILDKLHTSILDEEISTEKPEGINSAWRVVGAYAWSVESLFRFNDFKLTDALREEIVETFDRFTDEEMRLFAYEIFSYPLESDGKLLSGIGATTDWYHSVKGLGLIGEKVRERTKSNSYQYLIGAPGYTCTMGMVLKICDAWGIFVFARQKSDKEYQLRTCACTSTPAGSWHSVRPTLQKRLSRRIQSRMEGKGASMRRSFFFSDNQTELAELSSSSGGTTVEWAIGTVLNPIIFNKPSKGEDHQDKEIYKMYEDEEYYIVLAFNKKKSGEGFPFSYYYYWNRCADFLRVVLPIIHDKHAISARATTTLKVVMQTVDHGINYDSMRSPIKSLTTLGIILFKSGEMSSNILDASAQKPTNLHRISKNIERILEDFCKKLKVASEMLPFNEEIPPSLTNRQWVKLETFIYDPLHEDKNLSYNEGVFEFVLLECLRNALSRRIDDKPVMVSLKLQEKPDVKKASDNQMGLALLVKNSCNNNEETGTSGKGLQACTDVAQIVEGTFSSHSNNDNHQEWLSKLWLPIQWMPGELSDFLADHLEQIT